jgi:hypothetical protein
MWAGFASAPESSRTPAMVKIAVAVAALGGALFFALRGSSENKQLDTPESAVTYICREDNHTFKLTPAQWDKLLKQGEVRPVSKPTAEGSTARRQRGGAGSPLRAVKCPKCGKYSCVLALDCPGGKQVPSVTADGQLGQCPN